MSFILPAMKAKLGTTNYYTLSMKAGELVKSTTIPRDIEGWKEMSVDDLYQREINESRVKKHIAPYLANNEDRFLGAIILAVQNFDEESAFVPLSKFRHDLPPIYKEASEDIGFLHFKGGELFVPLDGQHRVRAIKYAIEGKDSTGKSIPGIHKSTSGLANEDVTVMLVNFATTNARKIFNLVNRYAKPTTAGQNYVTADDDIFAVLAREVADGSIIAGRLVNYQSNTVGKGTHYWTTLAIIYRCNEAILDENFPKDISKTDLPNEQQVDECRKKVTEVWKHVTQKIEQFKYGLADPDNENGGDEKRKEIRQSNLLGKPVAQECLIRAYLRLTIAPLGEPSNKMAPDQACENLNKVRWGITNANIAEVWYRLLWDGDAEGKIITKDHNRLLAARVIAYMAGENLTTDKHAALLEEYRALFPEKERDGKDLPARVV